MFVKCYKRESFQGSQNFLFHDLKILKCSQSASWQKCKGHSTLLKLHPVHHWGRNVNKKAISSRIIRVPECSGRSRPKVSDQIIVWVKTFFFFFLTDDRVTSDVKVKAIFGWKPSIFYHIIFFSSLCVGMFLVDFRTSTMNFWLKSTGMNHP